MSRLHREIKVEYKPHLMLSLTGENQICNTFAKVKVNKNWQVESEILH